MSIVAVGIDLAKNDLAFHGDDAIGKPVLLCPGVPPTKLTKLMNQWMHGHHGGCTGMSNPCKGASIASFQPS